MVFHINENIHITISSLVQTFPYKYDMSMVNKKMIIFDSKTSSYRFLSSHKILFRCIILKTYNLAI